MVAMDINRLIPECDDGNVEYKFKLVGVSKGRIEELTSQMRYRCDEGNGEAYYYLGVMDDGDIIGINDEEFKETFNNLSIAASNNKYSILLLDIETYGEKKLFKILIREMNDKHYIDIKITIAGSVDSGKSTMLGVLTSGDNDNGRGSSRLKIFNHEHEIESGRTSSISQHIMGYDKYGMVCNYTNGNYIKSWSDIVSDSVKIVSFYDLCGHEKYLKTTIRGLTSTRPDLCVIMVGANMGINNITKEHVSLCITLGIPFIIVVSKIDICTNRKHVLIETIENIKTYIKKSNCGKKPYNVKDVKRVIEVADKIYSGNIIPIFKTSNVTGEGIDNLKTFFKYVSARKTSDNLSVEYHIDSTFLVRGVGTVVGGQLISGTISVGDSLLFGPTNNMYTKVIVKGIHCKKVPVQSISAGSYVCLALKKVNRNDIRRGHVLLSDIKNATSFREFDADIIVLKAHSTTITVGYEPTVHINSIRQNIKILQISSKVNRRKKAPKDSDDSDKKGPNESDKYNAVLRTGDRATVRCRFNYSSEYITAGTRILLAEGKLKIVGIIKNVYEE